MRQGFSLCPLLLKTVSEALAEAIRHEKKIPWLYLYSNHSRLKIYIEQRELAHTLFTIIYSSRSTWNTIAWRQVV